MATNMIQDSWRNGLTIKKYILLKKIKGTLKQHLKSKNKKKVFNKIISFIQMCYFSVPFIFLNRVYMHFYLFFFSRLSIIPSSV